MCIISFSYRTHSDFPLIVAANRDEFYIRPTSPLHHWPDAPITAGRDEQLGGTWLGVSQNGRFAAITNYRDPQLADIGALSRGQIATDFLLGDLPSEEFARQLQQQRTQYGPFNVLVFDRETLVHYNNVYNEINIVSPGVHCLSNATLNTPWPKVERLKEQTAKIAAERHLNEEALFDILATKDLADDDLLPSTGVPLQLERQLSAIFVQMEGYGTRCSTVMTFDGQTYALHEKTYENGLYVSSSKCEISL